MRRHDQAGTTSIATMSVTHASPTATCAGATSTTNSTSVGSHRQRTNIRDLGDRRPWENPATTHTVTKLTSTANSNTMSLEPTVFEA